MPDERKRVADRTIAALREFCEKLDAGVPIEATMVEMFETPDGPMHIRTPIVINQQEAAMRRMELIGVVAIVLCLSAHAWMVFVLPARAKVPVVSPQVIVDHDPDVQRKVSDAEISMFWHHETNDDQFPTIEIRGAMEDDRASRLNARVRISPGCLRSMKHSIDLLIKKQDEWDGDRAAKDKPIPVMPRRCWLPDVDGECVAEVIHGRQ